MADRRSISDALALTPDKLAFIHADKSVAAKPARKDDPIDEPIDEPVEAEVGEGTKLVQPARRTRRPRAAEAQQPTLLPHLLVPLTTRLHPDTAQALRRAYLEQKLRGQQPATQQEIVEEALHDWLRRHGFLS